MSHAKHHADLILCRKLPGTFLAKLCNNCEGRCVICDSYVRPAALVKLCQECAAASLAGLATSTTGTGNPRCLICNYPDAEHQAYYCHECVLMEKDRDGCPRVVNIGAAKLDFLYEKQRLRATSGQLIRQSKGV